jgi:hypothetical protein
VLLPRTNEQLGDLHWHILHATFFFKNRQLLSLVFTPIFKMRQTDEQADVARLYLHTSHRIMIRKITKVIFVCYSMMTQVLFDSLF